MNNKERLAKNIARMKTRMQSAGFPMGMPIIVDIEKLFTQMEELTKAVNGTDKNGYSKLKEEIIETVKNLPSNKETAKAIDALKEDVGNILYAIEKNQPEPGPSSVKILKPSWYKEYDDSGILKGLEVLAKLLIRKAIQEVDISLHTRKQNALAVKLVTADGKNFYNAFGGGGGGSGGGATFAKDATIVNISLSSGVPSSYALPQGTVRVRFRLNVSNDPEDVLKYAWVSGGPYKSVGYLASEDIDNLYLTGKTIYFLCAADATVELEIFT